MRKRSEDILLLYIAAASIALGACDRGCLATVMEGSSPTIASAIAVKQDCPTGLARCISGAVEITEGRAPCPTCACAWKRVSVCEQGCAIEDVELVREPDVASSLCKGHRSPTSLPAANAATTRCPSDGERFLCRAGVVYACPADGNGVPVATCTNGCAAEDETIAEPSVDITNAVAIMCSSQAAHDAAVAHP